MIAHESLSPRLRVAIIDHGSDGVADELRVLLRGVRAVELVPALAPDESLGELVPRASWTPPEVVVIALGAAVELGMAMMSSRRAVPEAAAVVVVPWFEEALFLSAIRLGAEDCVAAAQLDTPGLLRILLVAAERHRLTSTLRAAAFGRAHRSVQSPRLCYARRNTAQSRRAEDDLADLFRCR